MFALLGATAALFHLASNSAQHMWAPYILFSDLLYAFGWLVTCLLLRHDHKSNIGPSFFLYLFWVSIICKCTLEGLSWRNGEWFWFTNAAGICNFVVFLMTAKASIGSVVLGMVCARMRAEQVCDLGVGYNLCIGT